MNVTWKIHIVLLAALAAGSCVPLAAQSYTFEAISCNGYTPAPYGMNGSGTVVGNIPGGGFIYSNGKCQTYPGISFFGVTDTGGVFFSCPTCKNLYLLEADGRTIGPLPDYPGTQGPPLYCCADTETGTLAGNYWTPPPSGLEVGFFYRNGKFTSLPLSDSGHPSYWFTLAALNNTGIAVGTVNAYGFVLKNGKIAYESFPAASFTSFGGLNDNGVVVGSFANDKAGTSGIFTYSIASATWTELNFPYPYNSMVPFGISNTGVVALVSGGIGYNGLVIATPTRN